jgi:cell wall-associated NlpC family hydrolase
LFKLQEATTPRGIGLFRTSVKGNFFNGVLSWAFSYRGVPFVMGIWHCNPDPPPPGWYDPAPNEYKQDIQKHIHKGYEGLECSGFASWSFIWDGESLSNLHPGYPNDTANCVLNTDCARLHGFKGQTQHVVIKDEVNSDDDVDWDGIDDADLDQNGWIELPLELMILFSKMNLAQDGDMWFIDWHEDGLGEAKCPDHVGIYFTKTEGGVTVRRIIEANAIADLVKTTDDDQFPDPFWSAYWNGMDRRTIFRGLRRRSQ